jgi:hypothetical protein
MILDELGIIVGDHNGVGEGVVMGCIVISADMDGDIANLGSLFSPGTQHYCSCLRWKRPL